MERKELTDLPFVGALVLKGYQPVEAYKQGTRIVFVFEWDDYLSELEDLFFSKEENTMSMLRNHHRLVRELKTKYIYSDQSKGKEV